ncbi:MAG: hypothetical protein AAFX98_09920, partial [Pseudomonadota bacterium]
IPVFSATAAASSFLFILFPSKVSARRIVNRFIQLQYRQIEETTLFAFQNTQNYGLFNRNAALKRRFQWAYKAKRPD